MTALGSAKLTDSGPLPSSLLWLEQATNNSWQRPVLQCTVYLQTRAWVGCLHRPRREHGHFILAFNQRLEHRHMRISSQHERRRVYEGVQTVVL